MQVVLIAPFLMRFRLCGTTIGGEVGRQLAAAVKATVPGFTPIAVEPDSPMLFDHHTSTGGSRLSGKRTVGTVQLDGVGQVLLRFEPSGTGHAMVTTELPDRDTVHVREREIFNALNPLIERWVKDISERMLSTKVVDPAVEEDCQQLSRLLWWHRVLLDPPSEEEPASTRVYGVERKVHDDAYLRIGDGFTTLVRVPRHRIGEVLDGLIHASGEWIALDEANRLVTGRMAQLRDSRWDRVEQVDQQFHATLKLSKDLALRDMVRLEEGRYIVNAAGVAVGAALECWGIERERAALEVQLQSLRDMLDFHRTMTQSRRDEQRNRMLFVFTAIALFQSVLVWYDFAHEENNTLGPSLRLAVDALIVLLTLGVVLGALAARRRD